MRDQIREVSKQTDLKKKEAKNEYQKSAQEYQEKFREQSKMQKENIAIIKDQYNKVQEIYKRKMGDMQDRLSKETKKMETAERRRKLELEGYAADLANMKKKILFYQTYIMKLKKLVDDDQADMINISDEEEEYTGEDDDDKEEQEEEG